ncbi:MAG: peptidase M23 [Phage 68_12]|nr:MAG: peptidase M23 [Phage 68_12]
MRPVDSKYPVTLGYREKMSSRPDYIHRGIDFGCPTGTSVRATVAGTVVHAGRGGMGVAFGIHVVLKSQGIYHIYAHLSAESVYSGQPIKMGQILGKSGQTGNATGPHLHYGEFTAYSYTADRKPEFLDDQAAAPKPKPSGTWFTLCLWPLAGFDKDYGQAHWNTIEQKIVDEIKRIGADVYCLTEVPEPRRDEFGAKLTKAAYHLAISKDGRSIVTRKGMKVGRTKVVTLAEDGPANDDKQVVLAEVWPSNSPNAAIISAGHLEYRDGDKYDTTRVTQAKQEIAAAEAFAKVCEVPSDRIFYGDDDNSAAWVLEKAYEPTRVDAFDQAITSSSRAFSSICGWSGSAPKGPRTDHVKVHRSRPVVKATQSTTTAKKKLSNHLPTIVVVGKK